jgi:Leucine-rich repeat (LRR) protein
MNRNAPDGDQSADVASWNGAIPPLNTPSKKPSTSKQDAPALTNRKSSLALREQIAKARAAKKAAEKSAPKVQSSQRDELGPIVPTDDGFDFGIDDHPDPFGQRRHEAPGGKVLQQRISAARTTGRLNIAALDLKEMPTEVVKMYDMESMGSAGGSWAESVDLTRLIAADNEFEALGDELFPDVLHDEYSVDDDAPTAIFGGLETMDLHGNKLSAVPTGFRRLNHLTSLNLSNNRLDNSCLQIVAQMTALRDLKMANNKLEGPLNASISLLDSLEILDLHGNKLTDLPNDFDSLSRLRILNLGENAFESVSFTVLSKLPLTELTLKKNKLSNTLIDSETEAMAMIQTLDISCNQIKSLVLPGSVISFPVLHTLSASMNRLQELPDMTTWTSLLTLTLDENNISSIPESFTTLTKLRQVDFSGNDIRVVPPELARMDNLSMIRLAGNPLRDKKFATATTDELKEILAGRLEPPPPYEEHGGQTITGLMNKLVDMESQGASPAADDDYRSDGDDKFATPPTSVPHSPARSRSHTVDSIQTQFYMPEVENWVVKAGGLLDRSETQISTLPEDKCRKVAADKPVKQAQLHRNLFTAIPSSLAIFSQSLSSLSLSYNQLAGNSYMSEPLELPALKELNLASNRISDLRPMMDMLQAPALEKLDVSLNRLTSLPGNLLERFPKLSVLVATNNQLTELNPDTIRGLKILEVANNDIAQLDPRLGLLGGRGGLQRLEVSGNRFKVPRWNILDRGTHATLRWLRGRVPEEEMNKWRAENGDDASDMD